MREAIEFKWGKRHCTKLTREGGAAVKDPTASGADFQ